MTRKLLALVLLIVLLFALAGCAPTSARTALWGEIPRDCACRDTESMARLSADLQQADDAVDLRLESMHDGWQVFSVSFDPARVSADQVKRIIEGSGAQLIPAPVSP
jgi:hypothetical protein